MYSPSLVTWKNLLILVKFAKSFSLLTPQKLHGSYTSAYKLMHVICYTIPLRSFNILLSIHATSRRTMGMFSFQCNMKKKKKKLVLLKIYVTSIHDSCLVRYISEWNIGNQAHKIVIKWSVSHWSLHKILVAS